MGKRGFTLSHRELDRVGIIQAVAARDLTQRRAALRLDLSVRQVKRLVRRYREQGARGLACGHHGRPANNAIAEGTRQWALALIREHYVDFGPTFAHEKLVEDHAALFSVETLRQWMMAEGLWQPRAARAARVHPSRPRRAAVGELVQIDGSPHDWFEGRGPRCTLIVFIDDASGALMALRFAPTETTEAYMATLRDYLDRHGRPVALYSDKHSIFRVNAADCEGERTQFTRALETLDIAPIHANTPQAKGRVERSNQTLQDRLVKEMRLAGISDIDAANAFLEGFMTSHNARFARAPQAQEQAHRRVLHDATELDCILSRQHIRRLSKNLSCQLHGREFQITGQGNGYRLRGATVTLCEHFDESVTVLRDGQVLTHRVLEQGQPPIPLDDEKTIAERVDQAKIRQQPRRHHKPRPDHPWRKRFNATPTST